MNGSMQRDERKVEEALRAILDPLDRYLTGGSFVFGLALALLAPATFLILWVGQFTDGRVALGCAAGVFALVVVTGFACDGLAAYIARRRFNRSFPFGSADRAVALRILVEMETPSKGEERLRQALQATSPERIVRHRRDYPNQAHEPTWTGNETLPETPALPSSDAPSRPGGYYDYIPLEPRCAPPDEREARGDRTG